jgi:hypothetical protein
MQTPTVPTSNPLFDGDISRGSKDLEPAESDYWYQDCTPSPP